MFVINSYKSTHIIIEERINFKITSLWQWVIYLILTY